MLARFVWILQEISMFFASHFAFSSVLPLIHSELIQSYPETTVRSREATGYESASVSRF